MFRIARLGRADDRSAFTSGHSALDQYFRERVTQDIRRGLCACFVALTEDRRIAGYYTLSAASVLLHELPDETRKKLPRYPSVPAFRLGRLAVDQAFQRQGLGSALLADALIRTQRAEIPAYALVVDAIDQSAVAFYRHHGFITLPHTPMTLFLPLQNYHDCNISIQSW